MKTKIYRLEEGQEDKLIEVVDILIDGGLVAVPTETVYGLGADGLNGQAVRKIFEAKNRPMDNPLILHIGQIDQIYDLVDQVSDDHIKILEKLWPGPLTVVLKRSDLVPDEITAGLDSVAIRMPDKDITRRIITRLGRPLAAPSANLSTRPSPTNCGDVLADMDGRIEAIVDGGPCQIGIESTVLDLTEEIPKILRPGFYTGQMLEEYFGQVDMDIALKDQRQVPKSPGQKYKHYAPKAKVITFVGDRDQVKEEIDRILKNETNVGLMVFEDLMDEFDIKEKISLGSRDDLTRMAQILFESFRKFDQKGVELIIVEGVEEEGFGLSIMNRLKKASANHVRRV